MDAVQQLLEKYGPLTVAFALLAWAFRLLLVKFIPWLMEAKQKESEANAKSIFERIDSLIDAFKKGVLGVDKKIDDVSEKLDKNHGEIVSGIRELKERLPEVQPMEDANHDAHP